MNKGIKTILKISFAVLFFAICFFVASGPLTGKDPVGVSSSSPKTTYMPVVPSVVTLPTPVPTPSPTPEPVFEEYDISLMAIGDDLLHMGIVNTGKQADGSYDYSFLFEGITEFLDYADIKVINQETILAGNERGFSGYPRFNSPTEVADAIAAAGFNVVLQATNHAADQGIDGLKSCVSYWKKFPEVLTVGIHEEETYGDIPLLTIKDVTFAVLNYTYGPNASTISSTYQGHLDMLCDYDRQTGAINFTALNPQVKEDIQAARQLADVVVVFPHWGTEYQMTPSKYQQQFAAEMAEAGADLIIGTHPHVPQPVEWLTTEDGRQVLCYYSLGNYVSTQNERISMLGGMAWVTFHVTEDGVSISEKSTSMLPLVCHYVCPPTRLENVYLLEDYTEEMAARHGIAVHDGGRPALTLSELENQCATTFGDMRLYKKDILPAQEDEDSNPISN